MSAGWRIGRFLIAGGLLLGLYFVLWHPIQAWRISSFEALSRAQNEQKLLEGRIEDLRSRRASLTQEQLPIELWTTADLGRATALVQEAFVAVGREAGLEIQTVTPRDGVKAATAAAVGFRLEAEAGWDAVVGFLDSLERHAPPLLIDRAVIRRLNRPGERAEQPLVSLQIDISAPLIQGNATQ